MNMLKQQDTHSRRAASYTAFVLAVFISILFLLKWKLPTFEKEVNDAGVDVEVNWPPDPPTPFQDGGGGGGQDLPPSPPQPKAVMGKTNSGIDKGGDGISDFERTGGKGNGWGSGKGDGSGGGSGEGTGGGNGTGIGTGTGPRVTRGDRKITRSYAFEGELNKATLYVNISVSPEGIGRFVSFAKGSTATGSAYRQAIVQYLEKQW